MKIAIHHTQGTFSDNWIDYCVKNKVPFKIVNCYDNNIIEQLNDADALMWHHSHVNYKDKLFAKQLLYSLQLAGKHVFPDFNSTWHFDDKVGQKYLFEAMGLNTVPSYVFYDKKEALRWAKQTSFPKVFKLRGGASSGNVRLVRSKKEARFLIMKAFGRGFSQFDRWNYLVERWRRVKDKQDVVWGLFKGMGRLFIPVEFALMVGRERGYVYFQDFVENEGYDIRVVVVGNRAVSLKRFARKNDFRASGSGSFILENEKVDIKNIAEAFKIARLIKSQSLAIDFIMCRHSKRIFVVEMSYGFPAKNIINTSSGYWSEALEWIKSPVNLQQWIIEDLIKNRLQNDVLK